MLKLLLLSILLVSSIVSAKIVPATYFKITQNFIEKMVEKHDFDKDKLTAIFHTIKFKIADKTTKKKKKKTKHVKKPPMSWDKYKGLFITENRIKNGIKFWQDNLATLQRAEKIYHVPAEIIVAILGVETNYGNKKGSHSTLKTLAKRALLFSEIGRAISP
jgi:membrane-bound lytic murein transglycosylase B